MPIQNLAFHYNSLQKQMGEAHAPCCAAKISALFSDTFTKTVNGMVVVQQRCELANEFARLRLTAGVWTIQEKDVIPSLDNKKCTITYSMTAENGGKFDVVAILTSSDDKHIDSVEEICCKTT